MKTRGEIGYEKWRSLLPESAKAGLPAWEQLPNSAQAGWKDVAQAIVNGPRDTKFNVHTFKNGDPFEKEKFESLEALKVDLNATATAEYAKRVISWAESDSSDPLGMKNGNLYEIWVRLD